VWIVFAGISEVESTGNVRFFLYSLDGMGARLDSVERPGAAAYLYDLNRQRQAKADGPS
jgi:hypothetical protein